MLGFTLIESHASVHTVPSFSVFDSVRVWICWQICDLGSVPLRLWRRTHSHAAQISFQERICPKEYSQLGGLWLRVSQGSSWSMIQRRALHSVGNRPTFSGSLLQIALLGWPKPSPDALPSEALPSSSSFLPPPLFTDVGPVWLSEGSPCLLVLPLPFIFLRC